MQTELSLMAGHPSYNMQIHPSTSKTAIAFWALIYVAGASPQAS